MTIPERVDLEAYQGDTFQRVLQFTDGGSPADISGATFVAELRRQGVLIDSFTVAIEDEPTALVSITLAAADTEGLEGYYQWDIEQDKSGVIKTLAQGSFNVQPDVSA